MGIIKVVISSDAHIAMRVFSNWLGPDPFHLAKCTTTHLPCQL